MTQRSRVESFVKKYLLTAHRERLLDWGTLLRAYLFLGPLEAIAGMAAFFFVLHDGAWQYGNALGSHANLYLQAATTCLSAIIAMQGINVLLCRHPAMSIFSRNAAIC